MITISPQRTIGDIDVDCPIEEVGTDTVTITGHPMERGAQSSDHAYVEPVQLTMRVGWSNASDMAAGDEGYILDIYEKLQALQTAREPFDVQTGKRLYNDMLISSMAVDTDQKTETTLMAVISMRQLIIVDTQLTTLPSKDVQDSPEDTAAPVDRGSISPQPAALSPGTDI